MTITTAAPQTLPTVTRFEVIDETGRVYVRHECVVRFSFQDDNRTLKVFVEPRRDEVSPC